jgi:hypothetical protein
MSRELARLLGALESETPDFDLFRRRVLAAERPTLRQLGVELGVSGERVRQREKRAREAVAGRLRAEGSGVGRAVSALRARLGALARIEELEEVMAAIEAQGCTRGSALDRRALLLFLTGHEVRGGWVQGVGLVHKAKAALVALTNDGPAALGDCCRALGHLGVREELRCPWLADHPGFVILGEQVARESRATDVSVAILRTALEPMDMHELFASAGPPTSYESFRFQVQHDPRFMRLGVRRYGLSEWGGDAYTTLAEEMTEEIGRNGGEMALAALVGRMVERFDVAEGSVLQRARAPQFAVDPKGRISRCVTPLTAPPKPLALTHNCFHLEAGWAMKVKVTRALLRGEAIRMPLAFARSIGLYFGTARTVACPTGSLRAYWPRYAVSTAYLSSLREGARELGAGEGDRLFVVHSGRDRLDFKLIEARACEGALGLSRLAYECGLEPGGEPARQILTALGLDPGLPGAREVIRARLGERHERRLVAWIESGGESTE